MIEYFVEVPNTGIQEPVRSLDDAYPMCYDLAQQFGFAEVCWYALIGKRVTEGSYTDRDYPSLSHLSLIRAWSAVGGLTAPLI